MKTVSSQRHLFGWQALSPLLKISIATLLGSALCAGILALRIGSADNGPLLIFTSVIIIVAGCLAIRLTWLPFLGTLVSGSGLVIMSQQPDVIYHMGHPREGDFSFFVLDTLLLACLLVTFFATLVGALQQLRAGQREARSVPAWMTLMISGIIGAAIGALLLGLIIQPAATSTVSASTNNEVSVHMGPGSFLTSSVTVPKGAKLLLVDDGPFLHILANGSWQGDQPQGRQEAGAPAVKQMQVNNGRVEIGPFTTAGTYHIYCSVHAGMNLTITVS